MSYAVSLAVTSARRLYRLGMGLGVAGAAITAAALLLALTRFDLQLPSGGAIAVACRQLVVPGLGMGLSLGLAAVGILAVLLGASALVRQLFGNRRLLRSLRPLRRELIAGREVALIESQRPQAFCAGLMRPRIYLSTGAVALLAPAELKAVVAHEAFHQDNRDPLRLLLSEVLADALFFLPGLRRLGERYRELAEVAADEAAIGSAGKDTVASALLVFGERQDLAASVVGIAPERVDHLLGQRPGWRLSVSVLGTVAVGLAALTALVLAMAASVQTGSISLAEVLAGVCMLTMWGVAIAMFLAALGISVNTLRRFAR